MIRLILGLGLLPTSALTLCAAARSLGVLTLRAPAARPFLIGALAALGLWLLELASQGRGLRAGVLRAARWVYVFGHEMTHVLAAWSIGARVHGMEVRSDGGHVELSRSGTFISLAPYCVPIYTILVIGAYRLWLWHNPGRGGAGVFEALVGATLAWHLLMTGECLWQRRQPDLAAAGGLVFSLAIIAGCNGLAVMVLTKALFPRAVSLVDPLRRVLTLSALFWVWGFRFVKSLVRSLPELHRS